MDSSKVFDGYAKDYTIGRPDYAPALISCMYEKYGLSQSSVIADIGSGTGKFAAHLLVRGSEVFCVEPNDDMRSTAENELSGYKGFHSVRGDAENTSLEGCSIDFITTAQAFHWFDVARFKKECERILKPAGKAFLIWNMRDRNDALNKDMHQIYTRYCPDFLGFNGGIKEDDERIKEFFDNRYDVISFDHPLLLNKERFIARSLSGSYSLQSGDDSYDIYRKEIAAVFEKYAINGTVSIANRSVAYIGKL